MWTTREQERELEIAGDACQFLGAGLTVCGVHSGVRPNGQVEVHGL